MTLLHQMLERRRPGYLRLGRSGEPLLHTAQTSITLGHAVWMRHGTDIALLASGPILGRALKAADGLAARGISASVASFHTIQPLDMEAVQKAARTHHAILTIEEHVVTGGFGTQVADALLVAGMAPRFGKFGVTEALRGCVGSQAWLLDRLGAAMALM
jgi:transketolase